MIEELEVRGFQSLREVRWTPGRLNVLIGPNGSGKSNLLQVLELLQKAAAGKLSEEILRLGGIAPLLWDEQARSIFWSAQTKHPSGDSFSYEIELQRLGMTGGYRIGAELLRDSTAQLVARDFTKAIFVDKEGGLMEASGSLIPEAEAALSRIVIPVLTDLKALLFHKSLLGWSIYHDVRVDREAPLRQAAVARFEKQVAADGQNLIPVLHTLYTGDRDFKRSLDAALRTAFGTDYEELVFPPAADQRVQLRLRWRSLKTEQSAANLSDGTLRFLLLIAILANPEPGDLIAIDEPETGLHPNMLPIIAELARRAAGRTQVILTTHSPQLLDAFTGEEPPTTTVAEWVDGETKLSVLDGEELRRWLQHYSLGAMFRSGELEGLAPRQVRLPRRRSSTAPTSSRRSIQMPSSRNVPI